MEKTYDITEAAMILNRTVTCLQQWDRKGKLKANRTKTNRRYYTIQQLNEFLNIKQQVKINQKIIAYCRVSSNNQKNDLKNQRKIIEQFCTASGLANVEFIEEIGGGLNFKRKHFYQIIQDIVSRKISKLILAHKDRFCRFGFDLIEQLCSDYGCELVLINNQSLSPEQEMVQDLMTIVHCFSSRLYGLRNYKKSLKEALKCN
jgi:predicted site-specific integrase-resolvase